MQVGKREIVPGRWPFFDRAGRRHEVNDLRDVERGRREFDVRIVAHGEDDFDRLLRLGHLQVQVSIDRLNRGEAVDPSSYYFRTTPYFETSSESYSWLNRICSIATGSRVGDRRGFDVFQVL